MRIELDIKKNVEQNAETYFNQAKKQKKKLEGALRALEQTKKKLELLEKESANEENKLKKINKDVKKEWYEKLRWFISSEGFLVIGGRDATSNEIVIKKHADKNDVVFHTDMVGSPFFVVKTDGKKVGEKTIREAADATVTFSRAWKLNLTTTSVFMAKPEQLTKEAPSGEFVPKGGFVTKGKLQYVENKVNFAVGIKDGKIMAGPVDAIKANCEKYIEIEQGREKAGKIAKQIKYKLGGDLDDIIRALPAGAYQIKK